MVYFGGLGIYVVSGHSLYAAFWQVWFPSAPCLTLTVACLRDDQAAVAFALLWLTWLVLTGTIQRIASGLSHMQTQLPARMAEWPL